MAPTHNQIHRLMQWIRGPRNKHTSTATYSLTGLSPKDVGENGAFLKPNKSGKIGLGHLEK